MMRLEGVSRQMQGQTLFADVNLTIEKGERIGVIGLNGSGKSTLLRIMGGELEMDSGKIWVAEGYRVGYLSQKPMTTEHSTVQEAVLGGQTEAAQAWHDYQQACEDGDLEKMGRLQNDLDRLDFFEMQTRADVAIEQLGLSHLTASVDKLSGGQRRRVELAALLTSQPDVLLLDEPTNHLDTDSIDWLEGYLKQYRGAVVMVTHDRYFLDRVTSRTLEVEDGKVTLYVGNYAKYLEKKAELQAQAEATASKRANLWRRELEWLRRGPRARATKQKARIERANDLRPEHVKAQAGLEMGLGSQRLGKKVMEIEKLSKGYGDRQLFKNFTYILEAGSRVGLIGPNGSGKTTLLDLLAGRSQPDSGTVDVGATVRLGYFDQESRNMDPDQKVLDSLKDVSESIPLANGEVLTASQMLDRFLFSGRLQHTAVGRLSGGERRRLYLLQILMTNPNVLFLDEPSNDLDIPTLSCLEDYLDAFPGTLLVSSHDRYFLDRCVDQLICFEGGSEPARFTGSYTDYARLRAEENKTAPSGSSRVRVEAAAPPPPPAAPATTATKTRKLSFKEKKELGELESKVVKDEARKLELETQMAATGAAYSVVRQAHEELEKLKASMDRDLERWTELAELAD